MKKIIMLMFIFILSTTMMNVASATNVEAGSIYKIDTISPCYGNAKVFVDYSSNITDGKYILGGCVNQKEFWLCECSENKSLELIFQTDKDVNDTFNIGVEFYIDEVASNTQNDSAFSPDEVEIMKHRRNAQYDNIIVGEPIKEKIDLKSDLPPLQINNTTIVVIFIFIAVFILIILVIWRQFTKEQKPKDDYFNHKKNKKKKQIINKSKKKTNKEKMEEQYPIDEEIADILKGL